MKNELSRLSVIIIIIAVILGSLIFNHFISHEESSSSHEQFYIPVVDLPEDDDILVLADDSSALIVGINETMLFEDQNLNIIEYNYSEESNILNVVIHESGSYNDSKYEITAVDQKNNQLKIKKEFVNEKYVEDDDLYYRNIFLKIKIKQNFTYLILQIQQNDTKYKVPFRYKDIQKFK